MNPTPHALGIRTPPLDAHHTSLACLLRIAAIQQCYASLETLAHTAIKATDASAPFCIRRRHYLLVSLLLLTTTSPSP